MIPIKNNIFSNVTGHVTVSRYNELKRYKLSDVSINYTIQTLAASFKIGRSDTCISTSEVRHDGNDEHCELSF